MYSFRDSSMVIRPKSIATVVVVFFGTSARLSRSSATMVIGASVVSGAISEMLATAVVLPTPKPPATRIFTGTGGRRDAGVVTRPASGELPKSIDHPHDRLNVIT